MSNPGRVERVDVQADGGHAVNNQGEGATAENGNIRTTNGRVGEVVPVTEPVTAAGKANGTPSDKQLKPNLEKNTLT